MDSVKRLEAKRQLSAVAHTVGSPPIHCWRAPRTPPSALFVRSQRLWLPSLITKNCSYHEEANRNCVEPRQGQVQMIRVRGIACPAASRLPREGIRRDRNSLRCLTSAGHFACWHVFYKLMLFTASRSQSFSYMLAHESLWAVLAASARADLRYD